MSKKKEETGLMPTALAGTQVEAGIDMRLTKSDLIEMVVEERKEQLEKQIEVMAREVTEKRHLLHEDKEKAPESLKKSVTKAMESKYKALIKAAKATHPKMVVRFSEKFDHAYRTAHESDPTADHGRNRRDPSGTTKLLVLDQSVRSEAGNCYYGSRSAHYTLQMSLQTPQKKKKSEDNDDSEDEEGNDTYVNLTLQESATDAEFNAWRAEVKKVYDDYVGTYNYLVDLKIELAELGRKGGRYKAELTKRLLGGTTQGKELLGAMDGVRALMLTDTSKKKA